jgi:hypothetical protein
VTPGLKYTLARVGIFVVCTLPAIYLLPHSLDLLVRIIIGAVVSMVISVVALRGLRGQMAEQIDTVVQQRRAQKEKLRAALAGDDEEDPEPSSEA